MPSTPLFPLPEALEITSSRQTQCPRKIFTERLPDLIEVSSRLTRRLRSAVQEIGVATCGKGGERLVAKLGIPLSHDLRNEIVEELIPN